MLEIVSQAGNIKSGIGAITPILKHPKVEQKKKFTMVKSHLLGGGLHQCGTWGHTPQNVYGRLLHSSMYAYRIATHNQFDAERVYSMFSDADLIQEFSLVSPSCMLRACRLTLFARLIPKAPKHMYDIGWIHALKEDLLWLSLSGKLTCSCDDLDAVGGPYTIRVSIH